MIPSIIKDMRIASNALVAALAFAPLPVSASTQAEPTMLNTSFEQAKDLVSAQPANKLPFLSFEESSGSGGPPFSIIKCRIYNNRIEIDHRWVDPRGNPGQISQVKPLDAQTAADLQTVADQVVLLPQPQQQSMPGVSSRMYFARGKAQSDWVSVTSAAPAARQLINFLDRSCQP